MILDMKRSIHMLLLLATLPLPAIAPGAMAIDPDSINDTQVQSARASIIEMIWQHQHPDRHWDPVTMPQGESTNQHLGGYTALVVLALVTAGESYQDHRLKQPLADLQKVELRGTYAVSTRATIWAALPNRFRHLLQQDAQWLLSSWNLEAAGWDYRANPDGKLSRPSPSVRHFGTLALWAASRRGLTIPPALLSDLETVTINNQLDDGAWHYPGSGTPRSSGSMTAAGLVTLYITQELLHARDALKLSDAEPAPGEAAIERGLAWMDTNYDARSNPGGGRGSRFPMYYQYAVERVGLASGLRTFGGRDWFREGTGVILDRLFLERGDELVLKSSYAPGENPAALRELCFSLLFLSRGRAPIAVNKLQFDGRWNNRPRDMANWCRWMSEEMETDVNWQVVDLDSEPESWLDAPILSIVSDRPLPWLEPHRAGIREFRTGSKAYLERRRTGTLAEGERPPRPPSIPEVEQLRRYIDRGGLVLAINEGRSDAFSRSMQDLGALLNPGADWNTIPADHPIYQYPLKITRRPKILSLHNGVRDQVLLLPNGDCSGDLQIVDQSSKPVLQTLSNVHAHASGMHRTRPRLDARARPWTKGRGSTSATIVRGVHNGQWKSEPLALKGLQHALGRDRDIALELYDRRITDMSRSGRPDLLLLSGTRETTLTEQDWAAIERFVREDRGVVLFEHAGGGDGGIFAATMEQAAMDRFGTPVRSAVRTSVVTGKELPGAVDCTRVQWTPYSIMEVFGAAETAPRLRCLEVDGHPAVFFSRVDLSHALLDHARWGIHGYDHESATDLMSNLLLYGVTRRPNGTAP